jgi:hypothetical protein
VPVHVPALVSAIDLPTTLSLRWTIQRSALLEGAGPSLVLSWTIARSPAGPVASCVLEDPGTEPQKWARLAGPLPVAVVRDATLDPALIHLQAAGPDAGELLVVVRIRPEAPPELLYARTAKLTALGIAGGLADPPELAAPR